METSREFLSRIDDKTLDEKKAEKRKRLASAEPRLRAALKVGDKLRGTKAECFAKESTYEFSHWELNWIVSKSGCSISPCSVYSVNGEVFRA